MSSQNGPNAIGINPHVIQVFVPPSIRLYSVSMTCDYDEGPVTFRVNVAPKPREPRDNITPSLSNPSNGISRRVTEDVKDTTIATASTGTETKRKRSADDSSGSTRDAPSGEVSAVIPVPGMIPFELKSKARGFLTSQDASELPAVSTDDRIEAKRYKVSH